MSERDEKGPAHDPLPERRKHFLYGEVTGGGTMMRNDNDINVLFRGLNVDAYDLDTARTLLREHSPTLGCRSGTLMEYRKDGTLRSARFDGDTWWLGLDRDDVDPELKP